MNYNLFERNQSLSIAEQIFKNRGIENYVDYAEVDDLDIINWRGLMNMELARDTLQNVICNGGKMGIISDSDADGAFSSGIFYNYFKEYEPVVYFHEGKEHGIDDSIFKQILLDIENEKISILIIPDAAADDEKCKVIKELGVEIICLDHHSAEKYNKYAILINPMLNESYPNKFLSGTGVVWKFLQCFSEAQGNHEADKYVDMVAYSLLSDSMDIRTTENRAILNLGLNSVNNKMLLEVIKGVEQPDKEENAFSRKVETPTDVSFNVVPLINGLIRSGSLQDKQLMFNAFAEINQEFEYIHPTTKVKKMETIYEKTYRTCKNTKAKQDREVSKSLAFIEKDIEENKRLDHKILFCKVDEKVDRNFTGLCAIKIASKYNRPVVMLREGKNNYYSGSIRNFDGSPLKNFKSFLSSFGYTSFLAGHENSAGIGLTLKQLKILIRLTDDKLVAYSFDKFYDVDFELDFNKEIPDEIFLQNLYAMRYFYGQGITKSYSLIKNIEFDSSEIQFMGKEGKKDTWKVNVSGDMDFIKFKNTIDDPFYEMFGNQDFGAENSKLRMNAICSLGVNEWNGRKTWQWIVEDYEYELVDKNGGRNIVGEENNSDEDDFEW